MEHRRAIPTVCVICRDFGRLKLRVVRVREGPDRGGVRGKVLKACRSTVAGLERSDPCSLHRRTLRLAQIFAEELVMMANEARSKRRHDRTEVPSRRR